MIVRRLLALAALAPAAAAALPACSSSDEPAPIPKEALSDAPLVLAHRFPTEARPGPRFKGCVYASPQAIDDRGARSVVVVDGGGEVTAIDPKTGARAWSLVLPAPEGEQAMAVSTPVVVGRRLVVGYHTIPAGARVHVATARLRHRVAVVDLDARALDPAFPVVDVKATVKGRFGDVVFTPSHALGRGALMHALPAGAREGRVYLSYGNVRDVQPYHGWLVELDLDAWRASGAGAAITAARTVTEDTNCGSEGGDGSRDVLCGGGVWAPSGPLMLDEGAGRYSLFVPTGNGQLDLSRGGYANTLMRVGPGLSFEPACDAAACREHSMDNLVSGCADSCRDVFIPRLLPGESIPRPEPNVCDGKGLYACWAALDHLDGGSTPVPVVLPSGKRVLVYPTKDGHLWLLEENHLGRVHAHYKLTELCGAAGDECEFDWAGTIVTKPAVTRIGADAAVIVPTFMGDKTHAAGVVAARVVEREGAPRLEPAWQFPPPGDRSSRERFRRHPSRPTLATPAGAEEHVLVVDVARPRGTGTLFAVRARDGKLAAEAPLAGPGYRFAAPLFEDQAVFLSSCDSDEGEGSVEALDLAVRAAR